jgi:hypothetical protein
VTRDELDDDPAGGGQKQSGRRAYDATADVADALTALLQRR